MPPQTRQQRLQCQQGQEALQSNKHQLLNYIDDCNSDQDHLAVELMQTRRTNEAANIRSVKGKPKSRKVDMDAEYVESKKPSKRKDARNTNHPTKRAKKSPELSQTDETNKDSEGSFTTFGDDTSDISNRNPTPRIKIISTQKGQPARTVSEPSKSSFQRTVDNLLKQHNAVLQQLERVQQEVAKKEETIEKMRGNNEKLNLQCDSQKEALAEVRRKLQATQDKLDNKTKYAIKLQCDVGEMWAAMPRTYGDPDKVSDDGIMRYWDSISFSIDNFASQHLAGTPTPKDNNLSFVRNIINFSHKDTEAAHLRLCRQKEILKSVVWRRLCDVILKGKNDVWGGPKGSALLSAARMLKDGSMEDFEFLATIGRKMSELAHDIDKATKPAPAAYLQLVDQTHQLLLPFMGGEKIEAAHQYLEEIYGKAVMLTAIFAKSRAFFSARFFGMENSGQTLFDSSKMERCLRCDNSLTDDAQCIVEFTVRPVLWKRGSADGGEYDECIPLSTARVVLNAIDERKKVEEEEEAEAEEEDVTVVGE